MSVATPTRWYSGITRYQWLVLLLASLGWVFDVFEGQIFVASMREAMPSLASNASQGDIAWYNNIALAAFLIGGALGGVIFGTLSDFIGRKRVMTYTILMYSAFTALSAFSQNWWQLAGLRFLVAMGVGGEWAVATTMVAEVFPKRARAWSQSIFHASSVLGTYLAVLAGTVLVAHQTLTLWIPGMGMVDIPGWRLGFAVGVLPALLIIWIRTSLREPDVWLRSRQGKPALPPEEAAANQGITPAPSFMSQNLTGAPAPALTRQDIIWRMALGMGLAAVGLATFWGVHIYGKDVFRQAYESMLASANMASDLTAIKRIEMLGMFLVTTGGGLGLVCFGPLSETLGRRGAFVFYHVGGLLSALLLFGMYLPTWSFADLPTHLAPLGDTAELWLLGAFLPIFGFLTLGMHAGYAVYFPELFPTRLRGTGAGFCFNVGRILAAPVLVIKGMMQKDWGYNLESAASCLSLLFLLGLVLLVFAPETRGKELPE